VPLSIVFAVLGVGLIVLSVFLCLRYKKVKRAEELGIGMKIEYQKMNDINETTFNN